MVHTHDFTMWKSFKLVDDWNYGFIDNNNLKRFLLAMGYSHQKGDGVNMKKLTNGIIRRFDLNGDGKLNFNEYKYSMQPTKQPLPSSKNLTIQDIVSKDCK